MVLRVRHIPQAVRAVTHASSRLFSTAPAASAASQPEELNSTLFNPSPEHRALREMVASFTAQEVEPQALEHNRSETFNHGLFRRAGELGLLGVTVDPAYGGAGMDATAACIVHEELAYSDPAFCLSYLAHSQLFVNNLARNGTEEQMARLLPPTCSGEMIGGMGMSEPHAGTDVLGMTTKAEKQADGSYVLTGAKMWITNGAVSDTELGDVFLGRSGGETVEGDLPLPRRERHERFLPWAAAQRQVRHARVADRGARLRWGVATGHESRRRRRRCNHLHDAQP